jgi:molybdate transport system substrate-binding protein
VSRGDAPLGIVCRTDVLVNDTVRIVDTFPADTHPPIVYLAAVTAVATPGAQEFLDYLNGPTAAAVLKKYGFTLDP